MTPHILSRPLLDKWWGVYGPAPLPTTTGRRSTTPGQTTFYAGEVSGLPLGTTMNTSARAGPSAFAEPTEV